MKAGGGCSLGIYQIGFAALFAFVGAFFIGGLSLPQSTVHWDAILGLAIICSGYGFVMQPIAQKYTTPESAGFLFSLEPVFAALFAILLLQEKMDPQTYLGALLILAGVFIANSPSRRQKGSATAKGKGALVAEALR